MEIIQVAPSVLKVHPLNQEFFDDIKGEEYERFRGSVREDGILNPLLVAPDMMVLAGHQRLRASLDEALPLVPIIVRNDVKTEDDKKRFLLAANFGRLKNDPIKQAKVFKEYAILCGIRQGSARQKVECNNCTQKTLEDMAKELKVSERTLKYAMQLADLDPDMQELISSGKVNVTTGYKVIAKLSMEDQAVLFASLPKDVKLSQREVREYVDEMMKEKDEDIKDMVERVTAANKEFNKRDEEARKAVETAKVYRRKLEDQERDIAGEFILKRDEAIKAARRAQERLIEIKCEADKTKCRLDTALKKLEQYENPTSATLEANAEICVPTNANHISYDVEELLRFMENSCRVIGAYTSSIATLTMISSMPNVKCKLENWAQTLIDSAGKMLIFAAGNEFSEFDDYARGDELNDASWTAA